MAKDVILKVTPPQAQFLALDCTYPAFIAGFGTGKSYIMCLRALIGSTHAPDATIAIYEPSFKLVKKVVIPTMRKVCFDLGIEFDKHYHKTDFVFDVPLPGAGKIIFCTMEDPEAIVGDECYQIHIDELDTFNAEKASLAWAKIIGRCRQWPRGLDDELMKYNEEKQRLEPNNQVCVYTTPEGFKFVYKNWVTDKTEDTQMIQASTYSNPFLPSKYIESIKKQYPGELVDAYLYGKFVNLTGGSVYSSYNREAHRSHEVIEPGDVLHVGVDFNVDKQAATVFVTRKGGKEWHAVREFVDMADTPRMLKAFAEAFAGHKVIIYPDASGGNRKSVGASISDLSLISDAGYEIRAKKKNPFVKDRIAAMNGALEHGHVFVNDYECPTVASCLEQQPYDKNKEPCKKSGKDHQNDATTYVIAYELPIRRPIANIPVQFFTHT